ncbi:uncharacterized protein NECHADRAFT_49740 [Fusarium vanettenii 77-13-4]|uniref:Heterokaryon incompatibility domain-containing protein n=1 Tax=Fusarium vanettenii (strain ATCC MYA-4622 / CBS 123669 / FGSC 9596 / NRRL 45880 / 77-13-4) TaxID=660122 RepID=C7ZJ38_FUSV7|nr:uncharacterized protein NECHADRAFT_49740 [Fusarium vanettenii 77-13-4]EEU35946.1 hypothetical protein NECHADRAFT_49740 [Fusarium vanettenii 77-13-4]
MPHSIREEHDQAKALKRPSFFAPAYCRLGDGEFRVMILEAGSGNDELSCRLCICKHSDRVSYRALSYAWGDPVKVKQVRCNGQRIGIGSNLHQALIHLRHARFERVIWADALCINQNDFDERGHQVRNMRTIFANAQEVLVWLGEADLHFRRVFGYINLSKWYTSQTNWDTIGFNLNMSQDIEFPSPATLGSLGELLEKPWFRRVWILQEVALANRATLMASRYRISWESFASLIHKVHRSGASRKDFSASAQTSVKAVLEIEGTRQSIQSSSAKHQRPLLSVLLATSSGECSDIRDKIFAVFALAGDYDLDRDADDFGPNYHLSPQEIFKKFAKWCISRGNLNVLSCTTRTEPDLSGELGELPSWVLDWTRIYNDAPFIRYMDRLPFNAGQVGLQANEPIIDAPRVVGDDALILSGVTVDVVKEVAPLPPSRIHSGAPTNLGSMLLHYKRWLCDHHGMGSFQAGTNDQNLGELFWRTMTAGLDAEGCLATDHIGRLFHDYLRQVEQTELQSQGVGPNHSTVLTAGYDPAYLRHGKVMSAVLMWSYKRRPAVTKRGAMALVPENTQNGDIIVVVAGAKVPLVLRRVQSGSSESYAVLGEAFANDVMDGSFLKLLVENQMKLGGQPDGFALRRYAIR